MCESAENNGFRFYYSLRFNTFFYISLIYMTRYVISLQPYNADTIHYIGEKLHTER